MAAWIGDENHVCNQLVIVQYPDVENAVSLVAVAAVAAGSDMSDTIASAMVALASPIVARSRQKDVACGMHTCCYSVEVVDWPGRHSEAPG